MDDLKLCCHFLYFYYFQLLQLIEYFDFLSRVQLNGISPCQGFGFEFLLTLQLVLCVLTVTDKRRNVREYAPLAYGLSVATGHLAGVS